MVNISRTGFRKCYYLRLTEKTKLWGLHHLQMAFICTNSIIATYMRCEVVKGFFQICEKARQMVH